MRSLNLVNRSKPSNAQAKAKQRGWIRYLLALSALVASFLAFTFAVSGQATVFGPKTYTRTSGPPDTFQEGFSVSDINSSFTLVVQNGDASGSRRVSSGEIVLNGAQVVRQSDFNQQAGLIQKTVMLRER